MVPQLFSGLRNCALTLAAAAGMAMAVPADACTNFIVGRKASADGSTMVSYADDSYTRFGFLYHKPAAVHSPGEMRKVVDWGDDSPRGEIPEVAETYNVVGNMNSHGLVIGETTWGGRPELVDTTGNSVLDYGSLIYIALERCRSAREAIRTMGELTARYGYASSGETFSIADKKEAWIMEMTGRGNETGSLWVAVRIPDDAICAHANEARIRKVDYRDKENVMYCADLFKFARKHGYLTGKDADFSFADAFQEHKAATRRTCDGRAWSFMRRFTDSMTSGKWLDWVMARSDEPMPLYFVPNRKVTLDDMKAGMRDHYEGTELDMTGDHLAGAFGTPYRCRPLRYEVDGATYTNERPVATQQTAWHFVSQSCPGLPEAAGGILWFGTDDANTSVYMPFYSGMTEVPEEVREGNGDLYNFTPKSSFWVNNWVANQVYPYYSLMIGDVRRVQSELEDGFGGDVKALNTALGNAPDEAAIRTLVNQHGCKVASSATDRYGDLARYLMVKYLDGVVKKTDKDGRFARNKHGKPLSPDSHGYPDEHLKRQVETTGDRFRVN